MFQRRFNLANIIRIKLPKIDVYHVLLHKVCWSRQIFTDWHNPVILKLIINNFQRLTICYIICGYLRIFTCWLRTISRFSNSIISCCLLYCIYIFPSVILNSAHFSSVSLSLIITKSANIQILVISLSSIPFFHLAILNLLLSSLSI